MSSPEVAVGASEEGIKDVDDADSLLFKGNPVDDDGTIVTFGTTS